MANKVLVGGHCLVFEHHLQCHHDADRARSTFPLALPYVDHWVRDLYLGRMDAR